MKNIEKYAEEILNIACSRDRIAVSNETGKPTGCSVLHCDECMFYHSCNEETVMDWANAEYIEKPKISEKDRVFLCYIAKIYKYVARDKNGILHAFEDKPCNIGEMWISQYISMQYLTISGNFKTDFPMVKWGDKEPWRIEDLKKLEVVEEYENN